MSIDEALNPQDPQDSSYSLPHIGAIANQPLAGGTTDRTLTRQVASGNQRGNWNILGTINIADVKTGNTVMSLSGVNDYFIFTNPTTKVNQILIGVMPDGTVNIAVSKAGVDVLTAFS